MLVENIVLRKAAKGQNSLNQIIKNISSNALSGGAKSITVEGVSVGNTRLADILVRRFGFSYTPQKTLIKTF